jgi:hypothetical protein
VREEATSSAQAAFSVHVTRATHCKQPIIEGRYKGRRCGNAMPCRVHPPTRVRIRKESVLW